MGKLGRVKSTDFAKSGSLFQSFLNGMPGPFSILITGETPEQFLHFQALIVFKHHTASFHTTWQVKSPCRKNRIDG
jgi:hypothetical protein